MEIGILRHSVRVVLSVWVIAVFFLIMAGCTSTRRNTTLDLSRVNVNTAASGTVKYRISKCSIAFSEQITEQLTNNKRYADFIRSYKWTDPKSVAEEINRMGLERYPNVFSDKSDAVSIDFDSIVNIKDVSDYTLFFLVFLGILPFPNGVDFEFSSSIKPACPADHPPIRTEDFVINARSWVTLFSPLGLIPVPGKSTIPKTSAVNGEGEVLTTRNWAMELLVANLVQKLSTLDEQQTAALKQSAAKYVAQANRVEPLPERQTAGALVPVVAKVETEHSPVIADTSPGVGIALIIGINKYDTLGELDSCQQDAAAIRETMIKHGGYNSNRVTLLTDNAPTREFTASYANLTRRINQVCKLAKPDDTLLIYFAGHGITVDNEMYLAPQDGDEPRTCISVAWLHQMMESSAATGKMLVLDACHSGKATRGVSGIVPSKFSKKGVLTLSSCADNELSYQEKSHGVFTSYLLAGLQGSADADKDNQVSSRELFRFIQANMENWSMRSGKTQRPQISDENATFILGSRIPPPVK